MGQVGEQSLVQALDEVVSLLERMARRPDRWESFCIMGALGHLERNDHVAARRQIVFARLPHELRPPLLFNSIPRVYELLNADHLRLALDQIKARPLSRPRRRQARRVVER